jgi:hypothetical protein
MQGCCHLIGHVLMLLLQVMLASLAGGEQEDGVLILQCQKNGW